ncbi:CotH kinase family protein [Klebsiella pneumoniae]|uniref:CotH kinase family protein n=1 Tax=Klebsiella pneumoniae TaxID=573 RepID=UPI001ABD375F
MAQRYNTGNPRPSNSMKDLNDNALANDDYMNSEADTFIDRLGDERDTLRGSTKKMLAAGAAVVEETRQNLIPLSRQYATLAAAQADIANIPVGATTYVRSATGSSLADEYMRVGDTLTATGRSMASLSSLSDLDTRLSVTLQRLFASSHILSRAINAVSMDGDSLRSDLLTAISASRDEVAKTVQNLAVSFQLMVKASAENLTMSEENTRQIQRSYVAQQILAKLVSDLNDDVATNKTISDAQIPRLLLGQHSLGLAIQNVISDADSNYDLIYNAINDSQMRLYMSVQLVSKALSDLTDSVDDGASSDIKLRNLVQYSQLAIQLAKLENFDPDNVINEATLAQAVASYSPTLRNTLQHVFPAPTGAMRIDLTLTADLPTNKEQDDVPASVKVTSDGVAVTCPCLVSVQGASSAAYPKKNFSIEFFQDDARSKNVEIKIGDLYPHDKMVFKSNWIDTTHSRLSCCYNLWDQVVKSRKTWPKNEVDFPMVGQTNSAGAFTGANGHPTLFPCVLYVNGDFYGMGCFGTAKKYKNYNLPKNSPLMIQLDHGDWTPMNGWADAIAAGAIEYGAPSKPNATTTAAVTAWDAFATDVIANVLTNVDTKLDQQNVTDFLLFLEFIWAQDLLAGNNIKNVQVISYDGVKWFFMPYDLDTVFGLHWAGTSIIDNASTSYINGPFWKNLYNGYGAATFAARYKELRDRNIFSISNVYDLLRANQCKFTKGVFDSEFAKWPAVPSLNLTSVDQILSWVKTRLVYLDSKYSYAP